MKLKKQTKKAKATKATDKVQDFYESIDLRDWWEEFSTSCNENGNLQYATVWSFITKKAKDKWKRDFLWWILGPKGEDGGEYAKYTQFDWEQRREKGHWYNSANAETLQQEVKRAGNALDAVREVGKVNVEFIQRIRNLALEIDREYSGRIFLPSLTQKENTLRAMTYTKLLDQLQGMLDKAQIMFGKTQGLDLQQLSNFLEMFAKGMGQTAANIGLTNAKTLDAHLDEQDIETTTIGKIARMITAKAEAMELDLPDTDTENIITEAVKKPKLIQQKVQ